MDVCVPERQTKERREREKIQKREGTFVCLVASEAKSSSEAKKVVQSRYGSFLQLRTAGTTLRSTKEYIGDTHKEINVLAMLVNIVGMGGLVPVHHQIPTSGMTTQCSLMHPCHIWVQL